MKLFLSIIALIILTACTKQKYLACPDCVSKPISVHVSFNVFYLQGSYIYQLKGSAPVGVAYKAQVSWRTYHLIRATVLNPMTYFILVDTPHLAVSMPANDTFHADIIPTSVAFLDNDVVIRNVKIDTIICSDTRYIFNY